MTAPMGTTRPLFFPLNRSADIESETPNETIEFIDLSDWTTNDPDERIDIVLQLSLNEYVALANTVDVGRDISYGDNSIELWWIWIRALQSMSICDSIIDCINDPESGVASAIYEALGLQEWEDLIASGQQWNNIALADGVNPTCDLDILFGQALQLVEYLNARNEDVLEIAEVTTNELDFLSEVIGDITFIDESSIDALLSWFAFLVDNIAENYLAQITTEYLEEVACQIFCAARENDCKITADLLFTIFNDRLAGSLTVAGTIANTLNYLIGGEWAGTEIADFMFLTQIGFRSQIGKFLGINGYADMDFRLRVFANDPNSDWTLLCEECVWEYCADWDTDEDGWSAYMQPEAPYDDPQAVFESPIWVYVDFEQFSGFWSRSTSIYYEFSETYVTDIELTYRMFVGANVAAPSAVTTQIIATKADESEIETSITFATQTNGNGKTLSLNVNDDIVSIRLIVRCSTSNTGTGALTGNSEIQGVCVNGLGDNPFA